MIERRKKRFGNLFTYSYYIHSYNFVWRGKQLYEDDCNLVQFPFVCVCAWVCEKERGKIATLLIKGGLR
jgi:hypothetical protein